MHCVLYKSDIKFIGVLCGGVACNFLKRVDKVRLVGIVRQIVFAERMLQAQYFEKVVRRKSGCLFECALQLARRHMCSVSHVGHGVNGTDI